MRTHQKMMPLTELKPHMSTEKASLSLKATTALPSES